MSSTDIKNGIEVDNAPPIVKSSNPLPILNERFGVHWTIGLGLLGIIIGLAGGYMFFRLSEQRKQIAYTSSTPLIKVFDSKAASQGLKLFDASNRPLTGDVYAAEVTIWNSGNVPIEPGDVRRPLEVGWPLDVEHAFVSIVEQTQPDVAKFELVAFNPGSPNGGSGWTTRLQWQHFDPGFAVKIRYLFQPVDQEHVKPELESLIDTYIVNTDYSPVARYTDRQRLPFFDIFLGLSSGVMSIILTLLVVRRVSTYRTRSLARTIIVILQILILLAFSGFLLLSTTLFSPPRPPF
ncbi:MAG TPA: hypothetical protein VGE45_02665 [Chloroflexia bacterium]|jgi:hypothetical protein